MAQKPFLWPIAFPEVLREGDVNAGFDMSCWQIRPTCVWRNWITKTNMSYAEAFPDVAASRADLLVYFYAQGPCRYSAPAGGWPSSPATST